MEKVLLVGKFTDQFREINKKLSVKYEVRACVNKLEIFRGMFKLNKPDVVVMLLLKVRNFRLQVRQSGKLLIKLFQ